MTVASVKYCQDNNNKSKRNKIKPKISKSKQTDKTTLTYVNHSSFIADFLCSEIKDFGGGFQVPVR